MKGRPALTERPGANLPPADFDAAREKATALLGRPAGDREALSYLLYPRVFPDLAAHERIYSDTSILPTSIFFFGPDPGAEHLVEIEPGKTLIVKLLAVGEPHADGNAHRLLRAQRPAARSRGRRPLAGLVGPRDAHGRSRRPQPDRVAPARAWSSAWRVSAGDAVRKGQKLLSIEAMKMETTDLRRAAGPRRRGARRRRAAGQDGRAAAQAGR